MKETTIILFAMLCMTYSACRSTSAREFESFENLRRQPTTFKFQLIEQAKIVYNLDSNSAEAKECLRWAEENGIDLREQIQNDLHPVSNITLSQRDRDSIVANATSSSLDEQLYHSSPDVADHSLQALASVFSGDYSVDQIKEVLLPLMRKYKIVINDDNVARVGNVVNKLSAASETGVTEMDILRHMAAAGSHLSFTDQAGLSAVILDAK